MKITSTHTFITTALVAVFVAFGSFAMTSVAHADWFDGGSCNDCYDFVDDFSYGGFSDDFSYGGFVDDFDYGGFVDDFDYGGFVDDFDYGGFSDDFSYGGFVDDFDYGGFVDDFDYGGFTNDFGYGGFVDDFAYEYHTPTLHTVAEAYEPTLHTVAEAYEPTLHTVAEAYTPRLYTVAEAYRPGYVRSVSTPVIRSGGHSNVHNVRNVSNVSTVNRVNEINRISEQVRNVQTQVAAVQQAVVRVQPQPVVVPQQPVVVQPQRPIVVQQPQALGCTLSVRHAGNGTQTLTWSTYGATRAAINNGVGTVQAGSGSRLSVNRHYASPFQMTVWSAQGYVSTCTATTSSYIAPQPIQPSVTVAATGLSGAYDYVRVGHIPYTGPNDLAYVLTLIAVALASFAGLFMFRSQLTTRFAGIGRDTDEVVLYEEEEVDTASNENNTAAAQTPTLALTKDADGPKLSFTNA